MFASKMVRLLAICLIAGIVVRFASTMCIHNSQSRESIGGPPSPTIQYSFIDSRANPVYPQCPSGYIGLGPTCHPVYVVYV